MRGADFSEVRRKEVWSIPLTLTLTLLREVVINALVHTDCSQRSAPICIAFFDDRSEMSVLTYVLEGGSFGPSLLGQALSTRP